VGGPSVFRVKLGPPLSGTVAVWGMALAIPASRAWGVPVTVARTTPAGLWAEAGPVAPVAPDAVAPWADPAET